MLLALAYLVASVRYFPGRPDQTLIATGRELLAVGALAAGGTLLLVSFLQRSSGERLPWDRVARIFLTGGLCLEVFLALHHAMGG